MTMPTRTGRKRGNNEGNIYQRPNGLWEARVSLPGGKRKSVYGKTRKAAADAMAALLRDVGQGVTVPTGNLTVAGLLDRWLHDVVRVKNKPRTFESYRDLCRLHITPALGRKPLARLTAADVQRRLNDIARDVSPSMAKHCRDVLRIALNQAVRWKLIPHNVAAATDPPRVMQHEIRPLSASEGKAILAATAGTAYEMPATLALGLGLRRGEVLGLRWADVDLDAGTITVRHQLQKVDGEWGFVEPKSKAGRRTLPIPVFVLTVLKTHRTRQLEARLALGALWTDHDLVCAAATGAPFDPMNLTNRFQACLKRAGLPRMRFHDLRHGCATLLLANGATLKEIQTILGQSDYKSTLVYAHVLPEVLHQNAIRMQSALGG